jgi:hypothetical protein
VAVVVACFVVRCAFLEVLAAERPVLRAEPLVWAALRLAVFRFRVAAAFLPAAWRLVEVWVAMSCSLQWIGVVSI